MLTAARLVRLVGRTRFSVAGSSQSFAEEAGSVSFFTRGLFTKASMLAEFFFALAIGSGMSCVP